jgi:hypothetical protein
MATKKALTATKRFGKKTYRKVACSKTKLGATQKAKTARKSGKAARVVKNPNGGYCLYTAGKKKAAVGKRKTVRRRRTRKK